MLSFLHFRPGWASFLAFALALPGGLQGLVFQVHGVSEAIEMFTGADSGGFGMPCKVIVLWTRR
jgi:hypothetical protein